MFRRLLPGSTLSGLTLAVSVLGLLLSAPTFAQDHYLNQLYGQGVHAFHSGNYSQAQRLLDDAIHAGSKDPRAYYFRAFTKHRSGGGLDMSDIQTGARYEVDGYNGYDIGLSLQRVQGCCRVEFEQKRRDAKLAFQRAKREMQTRPSFGTGVIGDEVLRPAVPQDRIVVPGEFAPADSTDPFNDNAEDVPPNPFGDDPESEMAPKSDDMSGDDMAAEDVAPPAEAEDDNLFGDDAPADPAPLDDGGDSLFDDAAPEADSPAGDADDGLFGPDDGGAAPADEEGSLDDLFG